MIYTTLNKIRADDPCSDGWAKLLRHLNKTRSDDEPLSLLTILNSNGLHDALWCLRAVDGHQGQMRLYAVWCARQVQHLMTDSRSLIALDVAERHTNGNPADYELEVAEAAAWDAVRDAISDAAKAAATAAAWAATRDVSWAAARDAAEAAAEAATYAAEGAQTAEFLRVFCVAEVES